jgi:hypothetical protein
LLDQTLIASGNNQIDSETTYAFATAGVEERRMAAALQQNAL